MRLFDGYIDRRPLMERDGSGVSALLGLDGFVSTAQLLDETSGEWWLAVETGPDAGSARVPTARSRHTLVPQRSRKWGSIGGSHGHWRVNQPKNSERRTPWSSSVSAAGAG
jgi:hypothetical protein